MNGAQLRQWIVRPVLQKLDLWSLAAENLLCMTGAWESRCGEYIIQVAEHGYGVARGLYQMEPDTYHDLCDNWLAFRPEHDRALHQFRAPGITEIENLWMCDAFATAACRFQYYRQADPLPDADDVDGLAAYAKKHWNRSGSATADQYANAYREHFS